jgi:hypothetical protein
VFVDSEFGEIGVGCCEKDEARSPKRLSGFSPGTQPEVIWEKGPSIES